MTAKYTAPEQMPAATSAGRRTLPSTRVNAPWSAATPPRYPMTPHAYICHGVHMPWPSMKLLVSAASAPTMKPQRRPSVAPAMMAMADTGLKSGTGANSRRPAAARAASTSVGMI